MANDAPVTQQLARPGMGMQVLGASHGFDPGASTSGFVLWINGRGVMVDPPLNSGDLLRKAGVQHACAARPALGFGLLLPCWCICRRPPIH
jgi:hypothetical protein